MIFNNDEDQQSTLFGKTTLAKYQQLNILIISYSSLLLDELLNNILNFHPYSVTVISPHSIKN